MRTTRKRLIFTVVSIVLLAIGIAGALFRQTIKGLYDYKLGKWEEDAFRGRPLLELQQHLNSREQTLEWCDVVGFSGITHRQLTDEQRVMIFLKGKPYAWFGLGTAQNAGYVVVQNTPNGEIVIDVLRTVYIDSL